MLVNIQIPFSDAARARRFAAFGAYGEAHIIAAETNKLNEAQRSHLMRMVSRGETALSVFNEPVGVLPYSVWTTAYKPEPEAARVVCNVHYLDYANLGDAFLLDAINSKASEAEIVNLALAGDIERWNVALAITRARLDELVNAWKRETNERIRKLRTLKDSLIIAEVKHCKVEPPQWLEDVVAAGDIEALELSRQLADAFREARIRLMK